MADGADVLHETITAVVAQHAMGGDERIGQLVDMLTAPLVRNSARPTSLPVVETWLEPAAALADGPETTVAEALIRHGDSLLWRRAYDTVPPTPEISWMHDGYAYGVLIGPAGGTGGNSTPPFPPPFISDEVFLGFSIQAPDTLYPAHHHLPTEIYGVIGGTADWLNGTGQWTPRPPGSVFIHEPHEIHGMRTGPEPLLAWAAWIDHPAETAYLAD